MLVGFFFPCNIQNRSIFLPSLTAAVFLLYSCAQGDAVGLQIHTQWVSQHSEAGGIFLLSAVAVTAFYLDSIYES